MHGMNSSTNLILRLFDINAIKFGEFTLKSGMQTPIYIDLRVIISYPQIVKEISQMMLDVLDKDVNHICGMPSSALPFASGISLLGNISMVMKRREVKDYGIKWMVEGEFREGEICCIIEDVITTGSNIIETANHLKSVGLVVREPILVIDRDQGGRTNLENYGLRVKSLFSLKSALQILLEFKKIDENLFKKCMTFLDSSNVVETQPFLDKQVRENITWDDRMKLIRNDVTRKLGDIICRKKTRLCVAVDVEKMDDLLNLTEKLAPYICILKIHSNIIIDFDLKIMKKIKSIADEKQFLIMEDGKFGDIGETTRKQLANPALDIISWADLITIHAIPGDGILEAVKALAIEKDKQVGCFIVAEMSSRCAINLAEYKSICLTFAEKYNDIVVGFISQSLVSGKKREFFHCTPGVKLTAGSDSLGQQYRSANDLKNMGFVDVFIVGRGIITANNPEMEAAIYQKETYY